MAAKSAKEILDLFDRPVDRHIEEVIKVDQTNADVVREEIEEYVPTEAIKASYRRFLERFQETPNKPHEGVGVWISGFFGAGKSSFAKILGYILEDRHLDGTAAAELFGQQTSDPEIQALLSTINRQIPARSIIFDISTDQAVTDASEKLTDVVYRVLLRELGYSTDREIAELEIELERQDLLEQFEETFEAVYDGKQWGDVKHLAATARSLASRVLHEMDPETYTQADSWARTQKRIDINANEVAKRAWELARRRADGRALVFVVDEVGQYVARSTDKMLDLQGLVQALGREGKNHANDWTGQVWLIVTSQERLSEVVDNLAGRQVELARLRDRFPIEIDLEPSDIREVTAQRILKKKPGVNSILHELFSANKGKLGDATKLERRIGETIVTENSFAELYPFLPYQIELIIDIVSGLRTQAGASRHVGGANRTIIKLAQQVLINDKTDLGQAPVGCLVTLDMVYDLQEGLVTSERRRDVDEIQQHFGKDAMSTRVAKALALLQFVKQFPRNVRNLATVLHPSVDGAPQRDEVEQALTSLAEVGKVRESDDGWELLSRAGKDWEEERRAIEAFPRDRLALLESAAVQLFDDVAGYRHRGLKTFTALPVLNGTRLGRSGDVELQVRFVFESDDLDAARDEARTQSNTADGNRGVYWVVQVSKELDDELRELHRSREMVRRHEREKLPPEQQHLRADEKARQAAHQRRAANGLARTFREGDSFFRGVHKPVSEYGDELRAAVKGALQDVVPKLYPKFDLAAAPITSGDPRRIIESESLAGLPPVYYEGDDGLGLVRREGGEFQIDDDAPPLQEIFDFIRERKNYGEDATGKTLETRFTGTEYGWDLETVMLLAATLFRAAKIEVYSGRRYTSYADTGVGEVFRKTNAFRAAKLTPRTEGPDLPTLAACAEAFEQLYGTQLAIEEGVIANAVRKRMPEEATRADRVLNILEARSLPGMEPIRELVERLRGVTEGSAEDVVLAFHKQHEAIRSGLARLKKLEDALGDQNLTTITRAREAVDRMWPQLQAFGAGEDGLADTVEKLRDSLATPDFFEHLPTIGQRAGEVRERYTTERTGLAERVEEAVGHRLDDLRNREEWEAIPEESRTELLRPFERIRAKANGDGATLSELRSDHAAIESLHADAVARLIEIFEEINRPDGGDDEPPPAVHRIRVSRFASRGLRSEDDVEEMIDTLREACLKAIAEGGTVVLE